MWSIIIVCQTEEELLYRNHFFTDGQTDGQTDRQLWWNQYTSTTSLAGVYKLIFNVEKSLKNDPPWKSKFHGGSHFFTTCGSKFNVKIWTVSAFNVEKWPGESLLTLKNDPGSHFSTGSLFNVTPVSGGLFRRNGSMACGTKNGVCTTSPLRNFFLSYSLWSYSQILLGMGASNSFQTMQR